MQRKILKDALFAGAIATLGIVFTPAQADAFTFKSVITGDNRSSVDLDMAAEITVQQGVDAGLNSNQAKWTVNLLNTGSVVGETNVGFKEFGFNLADRVAGFVTFSGLNPTSGWSFSGNGTQNQKLPGSGNMLFDYLFAAKQGSNRSKDLSFIISYDDGNASTVDTLFTTDFTTAPFSTGARGDLVGQAAGHVIGFENTTDASGVVAGEVPTPALLPGLVGMGVAALRKRKRSELVEQEA